jgi:hypothetical protein
MVKGTGGHFDYIGIAAKGNTVLSLKIAGLGFTSNNLHANLRVRAAYVSDDFIKRVTGNEVTEKPTNPGDLFPGAWAQTDDTRSSFHKDLGLHIDPSINDDGELVGLDPIELAQKIWDEGILAHVTLPDDAFGLTTLDDFKQHIAAMLYPATLAVWTGLCAQKYQDGGKVSGGNPAGQGVAAATAGYEPSLGDLADEIGVTGEDDDDSPDEDVAEDEFADHDLEDDEDDADSGEEDTAEDDDTNVTKFPG